MNLSGIPREIVVKLSRKTNKKKIPLGQRPTERIYGRNPRINSQKLRKNFEKTQRTIYGSKYVKINLWMKTWKELEKPRKKVRLTFKKKKPLINVRGKTCGKCMRNCIRNRRRNSEINSRKNYG